MSVCVCVQCPKTRWRSCPACQQRIQDQDLEDEYELQSWFIRRINRFLAAQGKQLIGWDEILEGGLAEGACVMSWRVSLFTNPNSLIQLYRILKSCLFARATDVQSPLLLLLFA